MLLHQIRVNYNDLTPLEKLNHIAAYRAKRLKELETPNAVKVKSKVSIGTGPKKAKTAKLSPEEKALLKKLGLSLKALKNVE